MGNFQSYHANPNELLDQNHKTNLPKFVLNEILNQNLNKSKSEWTNKIPIKILNATYEVPICYHYDFGPNDVVDPNIIQNYSIPFENISVKDYMLYLYNLGFEESAQYQSRRKFPVFDIINHINPSKFLFQPLHVWFLDCRSDPFLFYGLKIDIYGSLEVKFTKSQNMSRKCYKLTHFEHYIETSREWIRSKFEIYPNCFLTLEKSNVLYTQESGLQENELGLVKEKSKLSLSVEGATYELLKSRTSPDIDFLKFAFKFEVNAECESCFLEIGTLECLVDPFYSYLATTKTIYFPKSKYIVSMSELCEFSVDRHLDSEGETVIWTTLSIRHEIRPRSFMRLMWQFNAWDCFSRELRSKRYMYGYQDQKNDIIKTNGFNYFFKEFGVMDWKERSFLLPLVEHELKDGNFYNDEELAPYAYRFTMDERFEMIHVNQDTLVILIDFPTRTFYQNGQILNVKWRYDDVLSRIREFVANNNLCDVRLKFE